MDGWWGPWGSRLDPMPGQRTQDWGGMKGGAGQPVPGWDVGSEVQSQSLTETVVTY